MVKRIIMKKLKILTAVLSITCLILIVILFSLLKERKSNFNNSSYDELFSTMSHNVKYELLNNFVGGGIGEGYWKEQVDSMYFYLDKLKHSNSYYDYCSHVYLFTESEKENINSILKSLDRYDMEEKKIVMALLEYLSLHSMLTMRLSNYFPFDRLIHYSTLPLKGDTISLGDEYVAAIPFCCFNTEYQSIFVLDNDTVEVVGKTNIFSEKTKKRGHIKKEGYITYFQLGKEKQLPVKVEYYVK